MARGNRLSRLRRDDVLSAPTGWRVQRRLSTSGDTWRLENLFSAVDYVPYHGKCLTGRYRSFWRAVKKMICSVCGNYNPPGAEACLRCGSITDPMTNGVPSAPRRPDAAGIQSDLAGQYSDRLAAD